MEIYMEQTDNDFLEELTLQYQEEQDKRDFGKEVLDTMSYEETKELLIPLFESRIKKKKDLEKHYKNIRNIAKKHYAPATFEFDFCIDVVWLLHGAKEDKENQKQLDKLEGHWRFNESRKTKASLYKRFPSIDFRALVYHAKQVPIESLCKNPLRHTGANRLTCLCPFHTEKTPSFTIFTDTNTFFCFGCNARGDSITFYQKLYGTSFVDAVKQLIGTF